MKKLKIHLIAGARPNFIKVAPLYKEFNKKKNIYEVSLVHTGQHYDDKMSKFFFDDLKLPQPNDYLDVGSGSHAVQTARIMERYEVSVTKFQPDHIIVCGDVNSTLACALVGAKLNIPISHIESGLRSFDRSMPEEINRVLTDSLSENLFIPSIEAKSNLLAEGIRAENIYLVGNIMIDSLLANISKVKKSKVFKDHDIEILQERRDYILTTLHRPSNVDNYESLKTIVNSLCKISQRINIIFPVHPRTLNRIKEFGFYTDLKKKDNIILMEPLGYLDFLNLILHSKIVLTDSGGIQEETTFLGIPCLTLRNTTERPITITIGTNQLVKLHTEDIVNKVEDILLNTNTKSIIPPFWDGKTAERIVKVFNDKYFNNYHTKSN